jgi:hypothetical protein
MCVLSKHVYTCILVLCLGMVSLVSWCYTEDMPLVLTQSECLSLVHDDVPANNGTRRWCISTYSITIDTTTGVWSGSTTSNK